MKLEIKKFFNFLLTKKIKNKIPVIVLLFIPFIFLIQKDIEDFVVTIVTFLFLLRLYFTIYSEVKPGQDIKKLTIQNLKRVKLFTLGYVAAFIVILLLPTDRNIFVLILSIILTIVVIFLIDKMRYINEGKIEFKNKLKVSERAALFVPTIFPFILTIHFFASIDFSNPTIAIIIFLIYSIPISIAGSYILGLNKRYIISIIFACMPLTFTLLTGLSYGAYPIYIFGYALLVYGVYLKHNYNNKKL